MKLRILQCLKFCTAAFYFFCLAPLHQVEASENVLREVRILRVLDGESFVAILPDKKSRVILISGLKAPSGKQHYAEQSAQKLKITLSMFPITLICIEADHLHRSVCRVYAGNIDVAMKQIRNGAARWDKDNAQRQDLEEREAYRESEQIARKAGIGLWGKKQPLPRKNLIDHGRK